MRTTVSPSTDPSTYPFSHPIRVRFAETDAMGIVHHSRYLPYLEEARVAYLRDLGRPYSALRAEGVDLTVLEAFVQYRVPVRFDEVITVHVMVAAANRASFQMGYLITVDDEVRATAVTVHGAVGSEGRPTRPPRWILQLAPSDDH